MATYEHPSAMPAAIWAALWKDAQALFEMMARWNYTSIDDSGENVEPDAMAVAHNDLNHALTRALIELFGDWAVGRITAYMYDHDTLKDAVHVVLWDLAEEVNYQISDARELWSVFLSHEAGSDDAVIALDNYEDQMLIAWDGAIGESTPDTDSPVDVYNRYRRSLERTVHGWHK